MGELAHNPYIWFGIGIPVAFVIAVIAYNITAKIEANVKEARSDMNDLNNKDKTQTGTINTETGEINLDEEE